MPREPIKCKLSDTRQHITLNSAEHEGFIVGNGRTMYWHVIWYKSGNASVFSPGMKTSPRHLKGDTEITIHFK